MEKQKLQLEEIGAWTPNVVYSCGLIKLVLHAKITLA